MLHIFLCAIYCKSLAISAVNLNIYFPRSWLPACAAALLFISKSMLKLLYHVFSPRAMIDSRSREPKGPLDPRAPLIRCGVLEIMNICAIIMGVETRIGINFHMISAAHTFPTRKLECRARARAADRVVLGFSRTCQPQRTNSENVSRAEAEDTFLGSSSFRASFFLFPPRVSLMCIYII